MKILKWLKKLLPMKKITCLNYCSYCGNNINRFHSESDQELLIRKYVGGKGHLITIAYHRKCYDLEESIWWKLGIKE